MRSWRTVVKGNILSQDNWAIWLICFAWKEKWPKYRLILLYGHRLMILTDIQELGKMQLENWWQKFLENSPWYGIILWENNPASLITLVQLITFVDFYHRRGKTIFIEIDTYSAFGFAFPICNAPENITIHRLTAALFIIIVLSVALFSDQRTHFTANKARQWTWTHAIHWSYHISYYPEVAIEWRDDLLITQQIVGWQHFMDLG